MSNDWLIEGLREAAQEANAQPELERRVACQPSGFLPSRESLQTLENSVPGPRSEPKNR